MAGGRGFLWRCFALLGILIHAPTRRSGNRAGQGQEPGWKASRR